MAQPISRLQIHRTSYIVIPARLASTRLPRKLLLQETGKSVIHHTYEAARGASRPLDVCVAVDNQELFQHVHNFGGTAIMTDPNAASGTDRVAEIASGMPHIDIFVNVQGDEPEISGRSIDYVIDILENDPLADIATLAAPIRCEEALRDPSCVKVVCGRRLSGLCQADPLALELTGGGFSLNPHSLNSSSCRFQEPFASWYTLARLSILFHG